MLAEVVEARPGFVLVRAAMALAFPGTLRMSWGQYSMHGSHVSVKVRTSRESSVAARHYAVVSLERLFVPLEWKDDFDEAGGWVRDRSRFNTIVVG